MTLESLTITDLHAAIDDLEWLHNSDEVQNAMGNYTLGRLQDWAANERIAIRKEIIVRYQRKAVPS